jgi:ribonuclease HI
MTSDELHVLYCDGASRGNPGPAAIGVVLYGRGGQVVTEISESIGRTTNNVAEYRALIAGLEKAADCGVRRLLVRLDSQLLVRQVLGEYRVKAPGLEPLHAKAVRLLDRFPSVRVEHVKREQNTAADALANAALDR